MSVRLLPLRSMAKVQDVMFHVTRKTNLASIKKHGLLPAKKPIGFSKQLPNWQKNSIYFTSTLRGAKEWARMLASEPDPLGSGKVDYEEVKNFCVLQVNLSKVKTQLHEDPDFDPEVSDGVDAYYLRGIVVPPTQVLKLILIDGWASKEGKKQAEEVKRIAKEKESQGSWDWFTSLRLPLAQIKQVLLSEPIPVRKKILKESIEELRIQQDILKDLPKSGYYESYPDQLKPAIKHYKDQIAKIVFLQKLLGEL